MRSKQNCNYTKNSHPCFISCLNIAFNHSRLSHFTKKMNLKYKRTNVESRTNNSRTTAGAFKFIGVGLRNFFMRAINQNKNSKSLLESVLEQCSRMVKQKFSLKRHLNNNCFKLRSRADKKFEIVELVFFSENCFVKTCF